MWSNSKDNRGWKIELRSSIFNFPLIMLLFLMTLGITGCTTYNTATGRREFIAISTSEEVSMGRVAHQDILKQYPLSDDVAKVERVNRIGQRLAQVSDRQDYQHQFYLIAKDELNAFTIPGGNVYMFTGLYDKLKNDDAIAGVLAHEIGHGAARHTVKKFQAAMGYNLVGTLLFDTVLRGSRARNLAALGSNTVMSLVFSSYSRKDEYEADRLGVKYMYLAGYDVQAMIDVLNILEDASKGSSPPLILRSHPYVKDRIEAVREEVATVGARYSETAE